jgi:hypothetical protein
MRIKAKLVIFGLSTFSLNFFLIVSGQVELIYSDRHNSKEMKRNISLEVEIHP